MIRAMVIRMAAGAILGGGFGWVIYKLVGCRTGTCPLYGNPWTAVVMWMLIGVMMATTR